MLTHLSITNFVIIDHVTLDLQSGLTVITGETGAGKSIIMDALELALGSRTEGNVVRQGCERAEIAVCFDVTANADALAWLATHEIEVDEECIIRRVIHGDGRSRASVNGVPVTLQDIRELTQNLITIHGQHQHQALPTRTYQRKLLDSAAKNDKLCAQVTAIYHQWQQTQTQLAELATSMRDNSAEIELLEYQVAELDELAIAAGEYETLDQEHRQLSQVDTQIENLNTAMQLLNSSSEGAITDRLYNVQRALQTQNNLPELPDLLQMIHNASILLQESTATLHKLLERLEPDPVRLQELEARISLIHRLARKHHIEPRHLHRKHSELQQKCDQLRNSDAIIVKLRETLHKLQEDYLKAAKLLSKSRQKAAKPLAEAITTQLQELSLTGARLCINITPEPDNSPAPHGLDSIEILFSANPGQPLAPLSKVASGGEISRIGLAIHVITNHANCPTMVFDEVDVGIGGTTAAIVGRLLRQLATQTQIFCITHLPQVAANGHDHWHVSKHTQNQITTTHIEKLATEARAQELARMLGGINLSADAIANAKTLLADAEALQA